MWTTDTKTNNRNPQQEKTIYGLNYAYDLIESGADSLRSTFSPEWVTSAQYYEENNTDDNLNNLINQSFKIHLSKNPQKEEETLIKNFLKYKSVLEKSEFLKTNPDNTTRLTPKGEILTKSQCANPLLLAGLIYDEELKDIDLRPTNIRDMLINEEYLKDLAHIVKRG